MARRWRGFDGFSQIIKKNLRLSVSSVLSACLYVDYFSFLWVYVQKNLFCNRLSI